MLDFWNSLNSLGPWQIIVIQTGTNIKSFRAHLETEEGYFMVKKLNIYVDMGMKNMCIYVKKKKIFMPNLTKCQIKYWIQGHVYKRMIFTCNDHYKKD